MRHLAGHKGSQANLGLFLPLGVTNHCPTTSCVLRGGKMLPLCSETPFYLYAVCIPTILPRPYRQPAASSGNTPWPTHPPPPSPQQLQVMPDGGSYRVFGCPQVGTSRTLSLSLSIYFQMLLGSCCRLLMCLLAVCIFSLVARELSSSAIASTAADLMG